MRAIRAEQQPEEPDARMEYVRLCGSRGLVTACGHPVGAVTVSGRADDDTKPYQECQEVADETE